MSGLLNKLTHHNKDAQHAGDAHHTAGQVPIQNAGLVQQTGLTQQMPIQNAGMVQQTGMTQQMPIVNAGTTVLPTTVLPTQVHNTIVKEAIVQQTVRQDKIVEVQQVVHRDVDKNVVHHVEKHIQEAAAPNVGGVHQLTPVVQQQVHTSVVTEVQPIIHREIAVPVVERTEQHLTQHIVEPTIHTHEVIYEKAPYMQQNMMPGMQAGVAPMMMGQYQGLNLPYTGAAAHPQYGYQRLPRDQKAARFLQKAQQYEQRGNMAKAQKNREKAARYQQRGQPGYVRPQRAQDYYPNRASLFDQKAARYQQLGMMPQAQRYQGRAQRIRAKHNVPAGLNQPLMGQQTMMGQQPLVGQQGIQQRF